MVKNKLTDLDELTRENLALALWMKEFKSKDVPEDVKKRLLSKKNSPEAFGERMRYRIQDLLDNPDSYTPSYGKRYKNLWNTVNH